VTAFYSEFDPKAAAWLRELIKQGLIADGIVDERDLWDVAPADLAGFTQVHLCAGIGVWSYALRRAGWSDGSSGLDRILPMPAFLLGRQRRRV
jgi:DNA (cytosine-5)-methyltransferase 1